jgi:hypothetical protein
MQLPAAVVMVRPASFGFNPDTAPSFMFQREVTDANRKEIERRARMEFDLLAGRLRDAGVTVIVVDDKEDLNTPDAVFPNNWVSFHHDGTVVLYPMLAPSRRPERRRDIIEKLETSGFRVTRVIDLTHHENQGRFLEGTGSVVFDHADKIAYANISARTDEQVLKELCATLGYKPVTFRAVQGNGEAILHTDMTISLGDRFAVFCGDSIADPGDRKRVQDSLKSSGREIVAIDLVQLDRFAGNVLQVQTKNGASALVISTSACLALRPEQRDAIQKFTRIVESPLPVFEGIGRGSARCMMADVHLPRQ